LSALALLVQRKTLIANFLISRGILRSKDIETGRPLGTITAKMPCLLTRVSTILHRDVPPVLYRQYARPPYPVQGLLSDN
jgi:hypothetical protein